MSRKVTALVLHQRRRSVQCVSDTSKKSCEYVITKSTNETEAIVRQMCRGLQKLFYFTYILVLLQLCGALNSGALSQAPEVHVTSFAI